ncbi:MAG: hypothetical protein KDD98_00985 [Sphingomonadaceae bacterium]|nr:hypothetical protein [Sphingomonadaceae bacterium]
MIERGAVTRAGRAVLGGLALLAVAGTSVPAAAQDASDARIRKLESEVRALQRKVFPGGDGRFFEPQISGSGTTASTTVPSTTAVTDILARLDAIEAQLQGLTAQVEQNTNAIAKINARLDSGSVSATPAPTPLIGTSSPVTTTAATTPVATPAPTPAQPTAERLTAVQQIAKPQTDDPADDEYSYGYRLWNAGFYPEAQQQLRLFVDKYPDHWRATYGRNLLGRAYMDDGKPREAAPWFLRNYQTDKNGARAPDSLLFLAEAMIAVNDSSRACIALAEFGETYPAVASGRLAGPYQANLKKVTCN